MDNIFSKTAYPFIIAEIGNNHEGNYEIAEELVHKAADCRVDAVKFQTFVTEHYIGKQNIERFNRIKSFELKFEQFEKLAELAHSLGLLFISTPFDLQSAAFLENIVDCYKIASPDNTFYPLIHQIARTHKPVIMSTGLCELSEIKQSVKNIHEIWQEKYFSGQLALLHCVTSYPVPIEQANLAAIPFIIKNFKKDITVGYSDHTLGIRASILAVALGAKVIEKHFTLDHHYSDFRDHQLSANPEEMKQLVEEIRETSLMIGTDIKRVQPCEKDTTPMVRRSIVAANDLKTGHTLTLEDMTWTRPAGGLPPGEEHQLLGKTLKRSLYFGEFILPTDVK